MARKKKRTGGLLAPRKNPDFKLNRQLPEDAVKKGKGKQSGSRQVVTSAAAEKAVAKSVDKRLGSKKPITLVKAPVAVAKPVPRVKAPKPLSDEQQLGALEADPRLIDLLDRADEGELLSDVDQAWMEASLERISALMDKLGIIDEDDDEEDDEGDWDDLDDGGLGAWKDDD
jgi:ribosome assembly protein YihI (activator of Der GTPase)